MPPEGFEPTISAGERPKAYALDRAATGTGETTTLLVLVIHNLLNYTIKILQKQNSLSYSYHSYSLRVTCVVVVFK